MDYIKNTGRTCIGTSLTNLLVHNKDYSTAQKIMKGYRFSPFVKKYGSMHIGLVTRLVSNLTNKKYKGILHVNWEERDVERYFYQACANGIYRSRAEDLISIFEEETKKGRIKSFETSIKSISFPNIFTLETLNGGSHAVVSLTPKGPYIDDGEIVNTKTLIDYKLDPNPIAILEVIPKL